MPKPSTAKAHSRLRRMLTASQPWHLAEASCRQTQVAERLDTFAKSEQILQGLATPHESWYKLSDVVKAWGKLNEAGSLLAATLNSSIFFLKRQLKAVSPRP